MGIRDLGDKAQDFLGSAKGQEGIDQAAGTINEKTDNQYEAQVNQGRDAVSDHFGSDQGNEEE